RNGHVAEQPAPEQLDPEAYEGNEVLPDRTRVGDGSGLRLPPDHVDADFGLGSPAPVDGGRADTGPPRDLAEARAVVAPLEEHLQGGVEQGAVYLRVAWPARAGGGLLFVNQDRLILCLMHSAPTPPALGNKLQYRLIRNIIHCGLRSGSQGGETNDRA